MYSVVGIPIPRKKTKVKRLILVILLVCMVGLIFVGCNDTTTSSVVKYEITGTATSVSVTLQNATGGTEQYTSVSVPHTYTFNDYTDWYLYIAAQNEGESGSVTVKILVDGEVIDTATSSGAYVIASASGTR